MERQKTVFYREYVDLVDGDILAALMLSQIVYWYLPSKKTGGTKLRVYKEGAWWVAKSYLDWEEECGFTRSQSSRCVEVLKEKGLIVTRLFRFDGSPTVHLRLTMMEGKNLLSTPPTAAQLQETKVDIGVQQNSHCTPVGTVLPPKVHFLTETTTEITKEKTSAGAQEKSKTVVTPENQQEKKVMEKSIGKLENTGGEVMTVKQVLEKQRVSKHTTLGGHWQSRMAVLYPGKFQKPLTMKELGQLKMLANGVGCQTKEVIDYALNNWMKFASKAQLKGGLQTFPTDPHIGFLLAHYPVAIDMLQSIATPEPVVESVKVPVAKVVFDPKNVLGEEDYKPYKATPEEIKALLASL